MKYILTILITLLSFNLAFSQASTPQTLGSKQLPVLNPGMFELDSMGRIWSKWDTAKVRAAYPNRPLHGRTATVLGLPYLYVINRWVPMGNSIELACLAKLATIEKALVDAARDSTDPQRKPLSMVTQGGSYYGTVGMQFGGCFGYADSANGGNSNYLPLLFTYDNTVNAANNNLTFNSVNNYTLKGKTIKDTATTIDIKSPKTTLTGANVTINATSLNLKSLGTASSKTKFLYADDTGRVWMAPIDNAGGTVITGVDTIYHGTQDPFFNPVNNDKNFIYPRINGTYRAIKDNNGANEFPSLNKGQYLYPGSGYWLTNGNLFQDQTGGYSALHLGRIGLAILKPNRNFDVNGDGRFTTGLTVGNVFSLVRASKITNDINVIIPNAVDSVSITLHGGTTGFNSLVLPVQTGGSKDTLATLANLRTVSGGSSGVPSLNDVVSVGGSYTGVITRASTYTDTMLRFNRNGRELVFANIGGYPSIVSLFGGQRNLGGSIFSDRFVQSGSLILENDYNTGSFGSVTLKMGNHNGNYTINVPNKNGTVALVEDLNRFPIIHNLDAGVDTTLITTSDDLSLIIHKTGTGFGPVIEYYYQGLPYDSGPRFQYDGVVSPNLILPDLLTGNGYTTTIQPSSLSASNNVKLPVKNGMLAVTLNETFTNIKLNNVLEYTSNADAITNGLSIGDVYRTGDNLKIVH